MSDEPVTRDDQGPAHDPVRLVGLHRIVSTSMRALGQATDTSLDPILDGALAAIGTFCGVDRSYVFLVDPDGDHVSNTHEWCAPGISPEIGNLQHVPKDITTTWFAAFADDRHVYLPDVAAIDESDAELRRRLLDQDIRSLLVAPLGSGGEIHGFIGFDYVRHHAEFSPADLDVLRILADTIGATLSRIRAEERARRNELVDPLTGLANRAMFVELVEQSLAGTHARAVAGLRRGTDRRALRTDRRAVVGVLDLDRFAEINETLGFDAGDRILVAIGERLLTAVRPDDHVARVGADEFAILVDNAGDESSVDALSARMVAALSEPVLIDGTPATVTASIGFNFDDGTTESAADLISGAEVALRQAQGAGGARAISFDRAIGERIAERVNLTMRLRSPDGLARLRVAYQPAVELTTGRVVGVEALARYTDDDGNEVPPDVFVPVAEEASAIAPTTQRVVGTVLTDVHDRLRPLVQDLLAVSVNVSPEHLRQPNFVADLAEFIAAGTTAAGSTTAGTGPDPIRFWIELTESSALDSDPQVTANLQALADSGVRLAVDDFGTGYSSFARLRHLPLDGIKVDRSFITGIDADPINQSLVRAQVDIADQLDLMLLAEGCETSAEVSTLIDLGVRYGQGFGLHRPMPIDELVDLLERQRAADR